ncbi:PREDICTED: uncharacterized protein LOC104713904 [Camelina sativa]|uniref:Uncharacterized protein LOC104713904 n=1 Tax=Camelina sativa TaxID=90675 RepID=A0ABM0TPR7_CAMSA|nr:PREDICTED: uncharacterized protein LOC104713904 [Camelina sativa]
MEVMVGSSFGIGMAAYVRDRGGVTAAQDKAVQTALFLADESGRGGSQIGIGLRMSKSPEESSDSSSSSIGESSENEEEEEEEDDTVSYRGGGGTLDSFSSSLEDSLPIKRGLSNHYVGKSKSFGNLMEAASNNNAKDLEKFENPFNKRRRLVIANKLRMRGRSMSASNFYSWQNPNSMPLLALQEPNEDDHHHHNDEYEDEDDDDDRRKMAMMMMKNKRDLMAQTRSCFCLSSLQEEDDGDVDDDE